MEHSAIAVRWSALLLIKASLRIPQSGMIDNTKKSNRFKFLCLSHLANGYSIIPPFHSVGLSEATPYQSRGLTTGRAEVRACCRPVVSLSTRSGLQSRLVRLCSPQGLAALHAAQALVLRVCEVNVKEKPLEVADVPPTLWFTQSRFTPETQ